MSAVEFVSGVYEAFGRGDVPAVLGAMDPEIRWHEAEGNPYMPSGEPWVGPAAWAILPAAMMNANRP